MVRRGHRDDRVGDVADRQELPGGGGGAVQLGQAAADHGFVAGRAAGDEGAAAEHGGGDQGAAVGGVGRVDGDYIDIAHYMANQNPDSPSTVQWNTGEQTVRTRWRALVTVRQSRLAEQ
ncbi:hypothetical protein GCM10010195_72380 [Kitasatospora griseola]|nr:hypothetical protein GCM10010195_72380 [Kitasatospora griseola]